jgi:hypothetical protein
VRTLSLHDWEFTPVRAPITRAPSWQAPFYSALAHLAHELDVLGADGLVLFNYLRVLHSWREGTP